jgi:hypothetical protein
MRRILYAILLASFLIPVPFAQGRVTRVVLIVTATTGQSTAFTSNATIYSRKISFQADSGNSAVAYVGDSTLDATSATTLKNTSMASLSAGVGFTPTMSVYLQDRGDSYRLSDFRASGATGDKIRLVYEVMQ